MDENCLFEDPTIYNLKICNTQNLLLWKKSDSKNLGLKN